jgi:hypothetical protein
MTDVWSYSKAAGTDLLVLLALADMANDDGECWPSMTTIAKRSRLAERNARLRIRALEEIGEVLVIYGGGVSSSKGGVRSNRYRVTVHMDEDPDASIRVEGSQTLTPASGSENHDPDASIPQTLMPASGRTLTPASVEPSVEYVTEPSKTRGAFEDDFETVWSLYPKRVDRGKALRAYIARRRAGASAEDLLAATQHYAAAMQGTEARFIKHGATFFGPDEPFRDFVDGIPTGLAGSAQSKSMAAVDRVLASVIPTGRQELNA